MKSIFSHIRSGIYFCAFIALVAVGFVSNASASCVQTTGTYSVSGTVSGCYDWYTGSITVDSGASITSSSAPAFATTNTTSGNALGSFINDGSITAGSGHAVINNQPGGGTISSITNNGSMTNSGDAATTSILYSVLTSYTNNGSITQTSANNNNGAVQVMGPGYGGIGAITTLTNSSSGVITSNDGSALANIAGGSIGTLVNQGVLSSSGTGTWGGSWLGSTIYNNTYSGATSTIGAIVNTGSIYTTVSGGFGIVNYGNIGTLSNSQGAGNLNGALTYTGSLPTNYNIIIRSPINYGQLSVASGTGATTFGIYSGSTLAKSTYSSVLSGITSSNLTGAKSGNYNGFTWVLSNSSGTIWDLIVTGASTADTQQSLVNTASALQGTYTLQNSVLANSFSYDCTVFGANNVCVSAGGRNTAVSAANGLNNTSALLIAAYRPHPNYRIGAYADQNLSVSNPGGTVNLGNNTPLIGLFGAWNERLDGTGTEIKVSAAYGQKNTTVTRQVVGTSEAGTGSSQLNSQGAQVTAKYGFGIMDNVTVSPYVGVRYTQNNMGGYTEATSSSVTAPLTYSALNTNATTALAGIGASYRVMPTVTTFASAGVETDTNTSNGTYSATGITGLTPINFNANPVKTRPTATLGAYYDIAKNQRLGVTGIYRQEAYQAVSTTTVMATYTVGL